MREVVDFDFPFWVPHLVCERALTLWAVEAEGQLDTTEPECEPLGQRVLRLASDPTDVQKVILRLARDPQMRTVWDELSKKTCRVVVPAAWSQWLRITGKMLGEQPPHEIGLAVFFHRAALLAICPLLWQRSASQPARSRADQLRFEADMLDVVEGRVSESAMPELTSLARFLGLIDGPSPTRFINLKEIAEVSNSIQRQRGNSQARIFASLLAKATKELFGQVMGTTIATTTNVALDLQGDQQISREDVRNWTSRLG
jgi:hypothetical protein